MLRFRIKKKTPQIAAAKLIAVLADRRSLSRDTDMRNFHRTKLKEHDQLIYDGMFGIALVETPPLAKKPRSLANAQSELSVASSFFL